jgi:hypothetical protein
MKRKKKKKNLSIILVNGLKTFGGHILVFENPYKSNGHRGIERKVEDQQNNPLNSKLVNTILWPYNQELCKSNGQLENTCNV